VSAAARYDDCEDAIGENNASLFRAAAMSRQVSQMSIKDIVDLREHLLLCVVICGHCGDGLANACDDAILAEVVVRHLDFAIVELFRKTLCAFYCSFLEILI
jgi:hypothetical protein